MLGQSALRTMWEHQTGFKNGGSQKAFWRRTELSMERLIEVGKMKKKKGIPSRDQHM